MGSFFFSLLIVLRSCSSPLIERYAACTGIIISSAATSAFNVSCPKFGEQSTENENVVVENQIKDVALSELHPFKNHPFKVIDDEKMDEMVESIKQYGILVPAIVRERAEGGYELISGHRRHHAAALAGLEEMPVI